MPVLFTRRDPNYITWMNLLYLITPLLYKSTTSSNNQSLT